MDAEIAIGAARRLSIDVANLSFRLAMQDAEREHMMQLAMLLQPENWRRSMQPVRSTELVTDPDDTGPVEIEATVTLSGEQAQVLESLIMSFREQV